MSARVASAWLVAEGAPGADGWARLPEVDRWELDHLMHGGPHPPAPHGPPYDSGRDVRFAKLDRAAKLLALGALRALGPTPLARERTGIVLASLTGCLAADERFEETRGRPEGASPALFPATLATSPAAELSIRLGLGGPVFSVRAGFEAALALAARLVARGEADAVLACGLEVAARGARTLLGHPGPFRESVAVAVIDRTSALGVRVTDTLDLPRGDLLSNEGAGRLIETLNSRP